MLFYRGEKNGGIGKRTVDIMGPGNSAEGMNKDKMVMLVRERSEQQNVY